MKIALLGNDKGAFASVYNEEALHRLHALGECTPVLCDEEFPAHEAFLRDCEAAFSTWGMPALSQEALARWLPNLKYCFYAAGSVQGFARPLLARGIRLSCAAAANAIPVAEFAFAQILLAAKGTFPAQKYYRIARRLSRKSTREAPGNYRLQVGLLGVGVIGSLVAERLKSVDARVFAYDPFLSEERAAALGLTLTGLEDIFARCDVISNHLANKPQLEGILDGKLFSRMKPRAVFINTGRGAQVNERELARALRRRPGAAALLDVLRNEAAPCRSPLFWRPNAYFTPHSAGSLGPECARMAHYMVDELERWLADEAPLYEVTMEQLERMA